jgi:hypothetical protein
MLKGDTSSYVKQSERITVIDLTKVEGAHLCCMGCGLLTSVDVIELQTAGAYIM